MDTFTMG